MASTATRIYTVTIQHSGVEQRRLVRAYNTAQADAFGHAAAEIEDGIECVGCTD